MKRKKLVVIGIVALLLLLVAAGSTWFLNPILEKSLDRYAREKIRFLQKTPTYKFTYEDLDLDLMQERITLHNFSMMPLEEFREAFLKGENEVRSIKQLAINEVTIEGVGLMNFLWDKTVQVSAIRIDSVTLDLLLSGTGKKVAKKENKSPGLSLEGIRLPGIQELVLGTFEVGSFTMHQMNLDPRDTLLSFTSAGGRLEGVGVKKPSKEEGSVFQPDLEDLTLYLDEEKLDLRKNLYTMGFRNMEYSYAEQNLHIRDLLFQPREVRDSFRLKNRYSYEIYEATSTDLILEDFDLNAFLERGEFLTNRMLIDSLRLEIFRDKSLPYNTKEKALIHQKLSQASFPIHIGMIGFRDAYLNYVEQAAPGTPPLEVDFSDLDGRIEYVTSLPDSLAAPKPLVIQLNANLDQAIPIDVRVEMSYMTKRFTAKGHTEGTTDFSSLNKTVLPAIGLQFKSGRLDGLNFQMAGTPSALDGSLTLLYHNLEVELYKENHEKRKTLSWAANVLLKRSNPKPNGRTVVSEIYTERVPYKGLGNYLWKAVESGLINSLNPFGKHKVVKK